MKSQLLRSLVLCVLLVGPLLADDAEFKRIDNGSDLSSWDGDPKLWSVEDGCITGKTSATEPLKSNSFLVWKGGELDDFELKLEYKIENGNSGVQVRSFLLPDGRWRVGGYQADIEAGKTYSGIVYGEAFRGILALRGQKTVINDTHKPTVKETFAEGSALQEHVKSGDWNKMHIVAKEHTVSVFINDKLMSEVTDEDKEVRRRAGILALQLHVGPPMKVQFKNVLLKRLKLEDKKKVVFFAGRPSHGWGDHEHNGGCKILAKALNESHPGILATTYYNGWPNDPTALDNADCLVMYCDGGGGHLVIPNQDQVEAKSKAGMGVVCLHYGVEVPKGKTGDLFLQWLGGYFEEFWSVNPHWTAKFEKFPDHPITRGVKPFTINDEWYFNMRFLPNMEGVTPILSASPPDEARQRDWGKPRGGHSFLMSRRGELEHVAWCRQRPEGGGRGFGFTGGHVHWNWGNPDFRKVVLNAISWCAHAEIPSDGVVTKDPTREELATATDPGKNGDKRPASSVSEPFGSPVAKGNNPARKAAKKATKKQNDTQTSQRAPKPIAESKILSVDNLTATLSADITNAKRLFLVVRDGGDGFSCDWADWLEPVLVNAKGETTKFDLQWSEAQTDWGNVNWNKNAGGQPLSVKGKTYAHGIGTHAHSVISFDLPANHNFTTFRVTAAIDDGGSKQGGGSTVQFQIYNRRPEPAAQAQQGGRDPSNALDAMEIAEGLSATLFASEPDLLSPADIDVDARGRVWVCETVNYRAHSGKRPEGDRILILEDTNGDGKCDVTKVYYQGKEVDSAMGICVLGNKVIVSCSPNIWIFTDENGDDKPDRKELLFSKTGDPQHDHSAHAFVFGPDGKLYWNFGNSGKQVCDANGRPVRDLAGNEVIDNGRPYWGGMVFRCDPDGSNFETLAHNFRNNYEVAVDSFGGLWQSDNDDDGNKGVRINFVMEFGNYGFRDQMTGAGWQQPRTNMETEIPLKHWHLNDPGVVPNLLQTGSGSPCGICVYEGSLLPKEFHQQLIHCEPGHNVVRAYLVKPDGAGYSAQMKPIMTGVRDKWFRPSDVCVAPDGSLIVADWYDPGVGGHQMGDLNRGRIFRIAPPNMPYKAKPVKVETVAGAIEALLSPNLATRYLGWNALVKFGPKAEDDLEKLVQNTKNVTHKARGLWLLGKIAEQSGEMVPNPAAAEKNPADNKAVDKPKTIPKWQTVVDWAVGQPEAEIRQMGVRLARQLKDPGLAKLAIGLAEDQDPGVRREALIALKYLDPTEEVQQAWTDLANSFKPLDKWYTEAIGIAADGKWDPLLAHWLQGTFQPWHSESGRLVIWRSRGSRTPELLTTIIKNPNTPTDKLPKYFRSFDFLDPEATSTAMAELLKALDPADQARAEIILREALVRLDPKELESIPDVKTKLTGLLDPKKSPAVFIDLVNRFQMTDKYPEVLRLAQENAENSLAIEAIKVLMKRDTVILTNSLTMDSIPQGMATARAFRTAADTSAAPYLIDLLPRLAPDRIDIKRELVRAIAGSKPGAEKLLQMGTDNQLDESMKQAVGSALHDSIWNDIRRGAAKIFPMPSSKGNRSVASIKSLLSQPGDAEAGKKVYKTNGTCIKCHKLGNEGNEVGPSLSEIGSKLSREALFESILYPSAGISHSFESYLVELADGGQFTGLIVSETSDSLSLRTPDGLTRNFKKSEINQKVKQKLSLMPADLMKEMTEKDLINVVEFMTTLKKK